MGCDLLQDCSILCCEPIRTLVNTEIMSPFITLIVSGAAGTITVGNKSQPTRFNADGELENGYNHTAVKSLKFGHSTGLEMEVEVTDEAGGSFATFINSVVSEQNFQKLKYSTWMNVTWGWIETSCDGTDKVIRKTSHTVALLGMEFAYQHGLMKFNLKGSDLSKMAFESETDGTFGVDDYPLPIKQAIEKICEDYGCNVRFLRVDGSTWEFGDPALNGGSGDPNAIKGSYKAHGEDFIQAIMRWIASYTTDRRKGIVPAFNSKLPPGQHLELILWESETSDCSQPYACRNSIGTYIVNGGKDSPVISFQPSIKYTFAGAGKSGGNASEYNGEQLKEKGEADCDLGDSGNVNQGVRTYNVVPNDALNLFGPKLALREVMAAQVTHAKANETYSSITAELKLQGDPFLADPIGLRSKTVALVVINPYHIQKNDTCGDWLQAENCNAILSNRNWLIQGSSHEVKEGSYTTTLKLLLAAPGIDISVGQPLGNDLKGWVIPNQK